MCCNPELGCLIGERATDDVGKDVAEIAAAESCEPAAAKGVDDQGGTSRRSQRGRAQENVIREAEDAFGTSVGRETIGIYSASNVRGFSAIEAGNARINGLYFDQIAGPSARIRRSTAVRVGLSALAFPFPAPTGVVEYELIHPGSAAGLSTTISGDSYENVGLDVDFTFPVTDELALGGGAGIARHRFVNGSTRSQTVTAITAVWKPTASVEVQPLWTRTDTYDNRIGPYFATGNGAPLPHIPRRRFLGQDWAQFDGASQLYGLIVRARPAGEWLIEAAGFRSAFLTKRDAFVLFDDLQLDGSGRYLVFTDPPGHTGSTSGEARLSYRFDEGQREHRLTFSARARDREQLSGGSDVRDYGVIDIADVPEFYRPDFAFGEQTIDRIGQVSAGLTYHLLWDGIGELSTGISRTRYRRRIDRPGSARGESSTSNWLYGGTVAIDVASGLKIYTGYTRGLEDGGAAPQNASNRNEAFPAIVTSQRDGGVRWDLSDRIRLIGGIFDLRKPYYGRDTTGAYVQLGSTRNRGIEFSLSGQATNELEIVIGAVLLDPRVTDKGVRPGDIGSRPVGIPRRLLDASFDWATPLRGLSLDLHVVHQSEIPATALNSFFVAGRTLVDLGGRYRFRVASADAALRISVSNIADKRGFELRGEGTYDLIDGRIVSAYLTMDL
jgi:iron complex outermembrane recepter protein